MIYSWHRRFLKSDFANSLHCCWRNLKNVVTSQQELYPFSHTRVTHLWMTQADAKWWLLPRSTEKMGDALKVKYWFPLKRPGVGITTANFANLSSATNEHKVLPQTGFLATPWAWGDALELEVMLSVDRQTYIAI